jgi:hypothetical protein
MTRSNRSWTLATLVGFAGALGLAGCDEAQKEKAGAIEKKVEAGAKKAGEVIKDDLHKGAEAVKDGAHKAVEVGKEVGEKAKEVTGKAMEATGKAMEKTGKAIEKAGEKLEGQPK